MNILVHTDDYNFINNQYKKLQVLTFFNRGYARRMITCVAKPIPLTFSDNIDKQMILEKQRNKDSSEQIDFVSQCFREMYQSNKRGGGNVYTLSENADRLLLEYKIYLNSLMQNYDASETHIVKEIGSRAWKALKLSCLISAYEFPEEKVIDQSFIESAIKMIEFYGNNYISFFNVKQDSEYMKLLVLFRKNIGQWLKTVEIRDAVQVDRNDFSKWFKDNYQSVQEYLVGTNFVIEEEELKPRGMKYRMVKLSNISNPHDYFTTNQNDLT